MKFTAALTAAAALLLCNKAEAYELSQPSLARRARCAACTMRTSRALFMQEEEAEKSSIYSPDTYTIMLKTLLETENPIDQQISANYNLVDYTFLQQLEDRIKADIDEERSRLQDIKDAVTTEMRKRMETATETLRSILSSPTAVVMEGKMAGLARQGKVDDALLQLLEANLQQAAQAGEAGKGAVAALNKLKARVNDELDKKLPPPTALLRRLLRMDSRPARLALLKEKMAAKEASQVVIASAVEAPKAPSREDVEANQAEVDPRDMSKAIAELKQRFGNVDEQYDTGFVAKVETVTAEAEEVALELAGGREVTSKEQQDMMWNSGSVSVWDLGQVEEDAHQNNAYAVWEPEGQELIRKEQESRMKGLNQEQQ